MLFDLSRWIFSKYQIL